MGLPVFFPFFFFAFFFLVFFFFFVFLLVTFFSFFFFFFPNPNIPPIPLTILLPLFITLFLICFLLFHKLFAPFKTFAAVLIPVTELKKKKRGENNTYIVVFV